MSTCGVIGVGTVRHGDRGLDPCARPYWPGPRLLDVVQGRSKRVLSSWLAARPQGMEGDTIEIVAMDGFGGCKARQSASFQGAVAVMDPFMLLPSLSTP